jgi:hypothetical protein
MLFIEFYEKKINNKIDFVLGSDGYIPILDKRKTINTILRDIDMLKSYRQKEYTRFKIKSGSLLSNSVLYTNF